MSHAPEIVFRLGPRQLSLPLAAVREVVLPGRLSRVPRAPPEICGAMNVRGRAVLVVDTGLLLGEKSAVQSGFSERILILDPRRRDLGLWVSEVLAIVNLASLAPREGPSPEAPQRSEAVPQPLAVESLVAAVAALFSVAKRGRSPMLANLTAGR